MYRRAELTELSITPSPADEYAYVQAVGRGELGAGEIVKLMDAAEMRLKSLGGVRVVYLPPETTGCWYVQEVV